MDDQYFSARYTQLQALEARVYDRSPQSSYMMLFSLLGTNFYEIFMYTTRQDRFPGKAIKFLLSVWAQPARLLC